MAVYLIDHSKPGAFIKTVLDTAQQFFTSSRIMGLQNDELIHGWVMESPQRELSIVEWGVHANWCRRETSPYCMLETHLHQSKFRISVCVASFIN